MLDEIGLLVAGGIFCFLMAYAMGANDESMGTVVGSKALTMKKALIFASIVELIGSVFLGGTVTQTFQGRMVVETARLHDKLLYMLALLCALIGTAAFLIVASYFGLPVSTTHGIVGAVIGVVMVSDGVSAINWYQMGMIAISWVASPIAGMLVTAGTYQVIRFGIYKRKNPLQAAEQLAPFIYAVVQSVIVFIFVNSATFPGGAKAPMWVALLIGGIVLVGLVILVHFVYIPKYVRPRYITTLEVREDPLPTNTIDLVPPLNNTAENISRNITHDPNVELEPEIEIKLPDQIDIINDSPKTSLLPPVSNKLFAEALEYVDKLPNESMPEVNHKDIETKNIEMMFILLQVVTAGAVGMSRGANDVSNGVGPFSAMYLLHEYGKIERKFQAPYWILGLGGVGIVIGLVTLGRRVIETIGEDITILSPTKGVCVELATALTVLVASKLGLPISSTHTLVGAVIGVGIATGKSLKKVVNWSLIGKVALSWIITIPGSAIIGIILFVSFRELNTHNSLVDCKIVV